MKRQAWSIQSRLTAALGLSLAFSLWWVYFDNIDGAAIRATQAQGRIWLYLWWLYAHLPLVISLAPAAVGVQYAIASSQDLLLPPSERWLLCGATGLVLIAIVHSTSP